MNKVKEIGESKEEKIGVGSLWKHGNEYFILAQIGHHKAALIHLAGGNRLGRPIDIDWTNNITQDQWAEMTGGSDSSNFTRVHAIEIRTEDKGE